MPKYVLTVGAVWLSLMLAQVPAASGQDAGGQEAGGEEAGGEETGGQHPYFAACLGFDGSACNAVLADQPGNLTARFMRGLAAELAGDDSAARADFAAVISREPRHFGAQLWHHVAATSLGKSDAARFSAWLDQSQLPPWPKALGEIYLGARGAGDLLALAAAQPAAARAEALCAAHYHIGRAALLAGDAVAAGTAFRSAGATGAAHVFEYQAALRALQSLP